MPDTNPDTVSETVPDTTQPTDPDILGGLEFGETEDETGKEDATETADATDTADAEATEGAEAEAGEDAGVEEDAPADEVVSDDAAAVDPVAEDKPATAPKKPAPTPEDTAAQAAEARRTRDTRLAEIRKAIADIRAVKRDDYDPFEHGVKLNELLAEKDELQEQKMEELLEESRAAQEVAAEEAYWAKFKREHPAVGDKGRTIWDEEVKAAQKKYKNPEAAAAVANEGWERRVKLIEAQRRAADEKAGKTAVPAKGKVPAKPTKPAPPVTPGGARAVPAGAVGRPTPKPRTAEEAFVSATQGGMKGFLR
jgi:hypothetical protein